jgi:hypothetical protein
VHRQRLMPAAERSVSSEATELDKLLALAISELKAAVDTLSAYAAVLDAAETGHGADTPALSAVRDSVAEVRGQTDLVTELLDTELDGASEAC